MNTPTFAVKAADAATHVGAGISVGAATKQYWGYTLDEWSLIGIFFGMAMAACGFLASLYFKQQHLNIARAKHKADPDE